MPCNEALKYFSDGANYDTFNSLETEDFFFIAVEDKNTGDSYNDAYYIAVKRKDVISQDWNFLEITGN